LLFVLAALFVAACASVATQVVKEGPHEPAASDEEAAEEPALPPFVAPPPMALEQWAIPDVEQRQPRFPYLPDESRQVSRSIGTVTHGWLVNARRIPQPHPHMKTLGHQYERGLNYTSDGMLELIEQAAAHVAEAYPGSVVPLGNFSAQGGGDIPYSASHNSGRDGDLGIFVVDEDGEPVFPPGLVPLDEQGRYEGEEGVYVFDAGRNWALVEGLIEAGAGRIQFIFISNPLKRKLLAEARRQGASNEVIRHARRMLVQPGGALPHNDHFHLRIYCSEVDIRSGCINQGRKLPGFQSHRRAWREAVGEGVEALESAADHQRLAAVRRLALIGATHRSDAIAGRLADDDARVRAASARALAELGTGAQHLSERLRVEEHPQVLVEIIGALGHLGGEESLAALTSRLDESLPVELPANAASDARVFIAEALTSTESPEPVADLIGLLESEHRDVRQSAARALRVLTNHRHADPGQLDDPVGAVEVAERWRQWYDQNRQHDRDEWLACGFRDAGYEIDRLSVDAVWDLCRAVADADHLSYNAQRVLMRLSGRAPDSLSWSKEDANFYWRRWFERRWRRFGAPPIPQELSTLE
jgi:murein endopeptidase